jgi:hypothetical protein
MKKKEIGTIRKVDFGAKFEQRNSEKVKMAIRIAQ